MTNVLSILDPAGPEPAAFRAFGPHLRTTLRFHDAIERAPHVVLPQRAHIKAILAFGRDLGGDLSHLLIHCHAGIRRRKLTPQEVLLTLDRAQALGQI